MTLKFWKKVKVRCNHWNNPDCPLKEKCSHYMSHVPDDNCTKPNECLMDDEEYTPMEVFCEV